MDGEGRLAVAGSGAAPTHDNAPWELTEGRCLAALKLSCRQGFILQHRSDAGRSFCSPSNSGGRQWQLATERWFGQDLMMSRVTYGVSPTNGDNSYGGGGPLWSSWDGRLGTSSNTDVAVT
jgi:hypothetical protein